MKKYVLLFMLITAIGLKASAQSVKNDVVAKNTKLKRIGTGFTFTEGPAVAPNGKVYFSDQPNDRIYTWDSKKGISLYSAHTGRSNGMYFDAKGQLIACADLHNQLVYFDEKKERHLIYEGYDGRHFNGPNDLWITPCGGIYFSDPYYPRDYWDKGHTEVQDARGVYYLSPDNKVTRVIDDYKQPNGLIGTPDGKILYVSDINDKKIWKYNIQPDGSLINKTLFVPVGSDGMAIDKEGNIYLTSGKIWIYSPSGKLIREIEAPEKPSNVCFGGRKRNILFITARTSVYTLKMKKNGTNRKEYEIPKYSKKVKN